MPQHSSSICCFTELTGNILYCPQHLNHLFSITKQKRLLSIPPYVKIDVILTLMLSRTLMWTVVIITRERIEATSISDKFFLSLSFFIYFSDKFFFLFSFFLMKCIHMSVSVCLYLFTYCMIMARYYYTRRTDLVVIIKKRKKERELTV